MWINPQATCTASASPASVDPTVKICSTVGVTMEEHALKTPQTHFSTSASVLCTSLDDTVRTKCRQTNHELLPSVLTPSVRNSRGIKFVMTSATIMSASGMVETALLTGNSPGLTVRLLFPVGTSLKMVTATKSVTILGVSLTALNARSQKQLANMTGTVLITMAMASATKVATLSPVAGMAWTVPLTQHPCYWMVF